MPDDEQDAGQRDDEALNVPERISGAVAVFAAQPDAPVVTAAQRLDSARQIYITWRNSNLRGLTTAAFAQVESGSAALIAAIAAAL